MNNRKKNATGISFLAALLFSMAVLAGCDGSGEQKPITLSGELSYQGDTRIPNESSARISMVERGQDDANKRIVAERSLHDIGQKPIKFDLEVAQNLIDPAGEYGLRAEIVSPEGEPAWATKQAVAIEPLQQRNSVSIELQSVSETKKLDFSKYRCKDGFHLSVSRSESRAVVRLGNRRLTLRKRTDGGTPRFIDANGNQLRTDQDERLDLRVDGTEHDGCKKIAGQTPDVETTQKPSSAGSSGGRDEEHNKDDSEVTRDKTENPANG